MTYVSAPFSSILGEDVVSATNTSSQSVTVTRAVVAGSEIEYTPESSATHVLYQCAFQWVDQPDANTHFYLSLMEKTNANDAWSYVADRSWGVAIVDSSSACSFENVEILLPTWTGSKYLALYIRSHLSSTECQLMQLKMDSSGYDTGNENYVNTLTSCTSLKSS